MKNKNGTHHMLHNIQYAFLGWGISNQSVAQSMNLNPASVVIWDDGIARREHAMQQGYYVINWVQASSSLWFSNIKWLCVTPGIAHQDPNMHALVRYARLHHVPLVNDIELFAQRYKNLKIIAITGTNGKTTLTSLMCHALNDAGLTAYAGGNIGTPIFSLPIDDAAWYVIELSSFQLSLLSSLRPQIALLTNISSAHQDRYAQRQEYIADKMRLLTHLEPQHIFLGIDQTETFAFYQENSQNVCPVSIDHHMLPGVMVHDNVLYDLREKTTVQFNVDQYETLSGAHNFQNIALSYAALTKIGLNLSVLHRSFKSFPGVPHRQENFGCDQRGVVWINDSKATNIYAATQALQRFEHCHIFWMMGGKMNPNLEPLVFLRWMRGVRRIYTFGQSGQFYMDFWIKNAFQCTNHASLDDACCHAYKDACMNVQLQDNAHSTTLMLLSPACPSQDQFRNFQHRGNCFKKIMLQLTQS